MKMNAMVPSGAGQDPVTEGIKELLRSLPQTELAALLKTMTVSLVQFGSVPRDKNGRPLMDAVTHAINSILLYGDAISLLNKPRMKKTFLAAYLNQKGVRMTMPPTKTSLCKDVLNYWGQTVSDTLKILDDEDRPRRQVSQNSQSVQVSPSGNGVNAPRTEQRPTTSQSPTMMSPNENPSNVIANISPQSHQLTNMEYEAASTFRQREAELGFQLGKEFSNWYFQRLNSLTDFTDDHFYAECNLRLEYILAHDPHSTVLDEIMMNGKEVCAKIKDLVANKGLLFSPNLEVTGIRGYINPHGLAQVMVCGTIFRTGSDSALGVFEQMFGLMKDPRFGNNYRIKFTVMRLREGGYLAIQNAPPQLLDSSLVGIVEEIDED